MPEKLQSIQKAVNHLSANDSVLVPLIEIFGLYTPRSHTNYYRELVGSIISQQLSVKAAAAIEKRFIDLFGGQFPEPEQILASDIESMRSVGLSRPKASYVISLAQHIIDGSLRIEELPNLTNDEIIKELIAVKGIGEWTAHMFLIFALGRLDILPVGDLGIRSGIKHLYGFDELPTPLQVRELADKKNWHPYESVATWYIWRSLDNVPVSS